MPSSSCNHIPTIVSIVRQLEPQSILDVGVGFGKWGHLFREYTDIVMSEDEPERYRRENWRIQIDGIEGFEPYLTPAHRYHYNNIIVGDMRDKIHEVGLYDVIFVGDVIEHLTRADGCAFLRECKAHCRKAAIVTTPALPVEQGAACGNQLEVHQSFWSETDFRKVGFCLTRVVDGVILIGISLRDGVTPPILDRVLTNRRPWELSVWIGSNDRYDRLSL